MKFRNIIERLTYKVAPDAWLTKYELSIIARCARSSIAPALSTLRRTGYNVLMHWDHVNQVWEYNIQPAEK